MLEFWQPTMLGGLLISVLVGWVASVCLVLAGRCLRRLWWCIRPSNPDLTASPRRLLLTAGIYLVVSMVLYRLALILFYEWVFLAS